MKQRINRARILDWRQPMKRARLFFLLWCLFAVTASAETYDAASASQADIAAKVTTAGNPALAHGDTVNIPPGTAIFTSTITVDRNITIAGAGIGQTIFVDEIPRPTGSVAHLQLTGGSTTTLMRVTGIEFRGSDNPTFQVLNQGGTGTITSNIIGTIPNLRIDHCSFHDLWCTSIQFYGGALGVIDNCSFDRGIAGHIGCLQVEHQSWKGVGNYGDNSWADDTNFGTDQALYVETNSFANFRSATCLDGTAGMRVVFRYNTVTNCNIGNHGTDTGGRKRGGRKFEIYRNTFITPPPGDPNIGSENTWGAYVRSGAAVIFLNTFTNFDRIMNSDNYRMFDPTTACWLTYPTGVNPWDLNGTMLDTGAHTGGNGETVLTDSGASFVTLIEGAADEGGVIVVRNVTQGWAAQLSGYTATTISKREQEITADYSWQTGDTYELRAIITALDSVGRGKSDLISGGNDATPGTPTAWMNQALEPVRVWDNSITDRMNGLPHVTVGWGTGRMGRDVIFSTDDSAALPGYTEYTYPHPLQSGSPPPAPSQRKLLRLIQP